MKSFNLFLAMLISCLILSSCLKGKDYDHSEFQKPFREKTAWSDKDSSDQPISAAETIQPDWWKNFKDPYLNHLIETAISGNIDLKIALARVSDAELSVRENDARHLPSLSLSGSESFNRMAVQTPDYSDRILEALSKPEQNDPGSQNHPSPNQSSIANSQYINIGLSLNWELDLWGKKKHDALATLAAYQESQATYRGG